METFTIEHLTFTYPQRETPALRDVTLSIPAGQFVVLCGKSGCGKSTLLRQLKPVLSPHGTKTGRILFEGEPLDGLSQRDQSQRIGFVLQSPDNQIVTDKVWHELAFGLESLGYDTPTIRLRVAEMASFFGIQTWFHKNVSELSGGQKQLLNLAAIMAMQPSVLILDEPTSQLDPIAAADFFETIAKINRELGTTIILTEHRLEDVFPMADRVIVMEDGGVIADGSPRDVGQQLASDNNPMFFAMPSPMRIWAGVQELDCPVTVREGRTWLAQMNQVRALDHQAIPRDPEGRYHIEGGSAKAKEVPAVSMDEVWFRYGRDLPDVAKGVSLQVYSGELYAMVGGNGTGKTTTISLLSGLKKPWRGKIELFGRNIEDISDEEKYGGLLGILPQNPQALFVKKTVELDLMEMFEGTTIPMEERRKQVRNMAKLCDLEHLMQSHPYDLSGGEQQRAAMAKVLLMKPKLLVLDEPTKGIDAYFKRQLAKILRRLCDKGVTIVMVSHDVEFCARYADRCAMFFDGAVTGEDQPRRFFSGKNFYTTSTNRMARNLLDEAVLAEDVILACGCDLPEDEDPDLGESDGTDDGDWFVHGAEEVELSKTEAVAEKVKEKAKLTPARVAVFLLCLTGFIGSTVFLSDLWTDWRDYLVQLGQVACVLFGMASLFPGGELDTPVVQVAKEKRKLSRRTAVAAAMILITIPLTIYFGIFYLDDRKYYAISMAIILQTMLPFVMVFEGRKPQARELVTIATLCAIGVAGRAAFFMLPHFKPVVALVLIAGVCLGGESGFLVGAVTGFVSNMFFGQGPWTPWQMFAFGIIGFLGGVLFRKGFLRKTRLSLCIFGGLSTFFIYGGIMNPASVIMYQAKPTAAMFTMAYLQGIPFDMIHAAGTICFLWFLAGPMIEKLDRIKVKYGLVE